MNLTGSGRTDAGTHARGLVANFLTGSRILPAKMVRALNSLLPRDIRVLSAAGSAWTFTPEKRRFKNLSLSDLSGPDPAAASDARVLSLSAIRSNLREWRAPRAYFSGSMISPASQKPSSAVTSTVRRIFRCELKKRDTACFLTVEGNGFLHHMVRNMAGTLLEVGQRIHQPGRIPGSLFETGPQTGRIYRAGAWPDPGESEILSAREFCYHKPVENIAMELEGFAEARESEAVC